MNSVGSTPAKKRREQSPAQARRTVGMPADDDDGGDDPVLRLKQVRDPLRHRPIPHRYFTGPGNHQSRPAGKLRFPGCPATRPASYVPGNSREEAAAHARTHRRGVPGPAGRGQDARGDPGRDADRGSGGAPRVPQCGAQLRGTVRHAARPGVPGHPDLPVAADRRARGDLVPGAAHAGRPGKAAPGVQALGRPVAGHARPHRRLPEQRADGAGVGRRLVRPGGLRFRAQHRGVLREGPRRRPAVHAHPHPAAGEPRGRGQPAGRGSADGARRPRGRQRHRGARRADARHDRPVRRRAARLPVDRAARHAGGQAVLVRVRDPVGRPRPAVHRPRAAGLRPDALRPPARLAVRRVRRGGGLRRRARALRALLHPRRSRTVQRLLHRHVGGRAHDAPGAGPHHREDRVHPRPGHAAGRRRSASASSSTSRPTSPRSSRPWRRCARSAAPPRRTRRSTPTACSPPPGRR